MVRLIADAVRSKAKLIHLRPGPALFLSRLAGYALRDVVITREEIQGLMASLLVSEDAPTGRTRLSDWLGRNADTLGTTYSSELSRHYR